MSIVVIISALTGAIPASGQNNQPPSPCSAEEISQFDFWIGEWELEWPNGDGNVGTGTNRVERLFESCIVQENFSTSDGSFKGMSVSSYNPIIQKWQQTWVDNTGAYLDFKGGFEDGKMTLSREFIAKDGRQIMQRMVYFDIKEDAFTWNWESSTDGGATWKTLWQINYKRKK